MKKFILWHKDYGKLPRSENGSINSDGAIGRIDEGNVYLRSYAKYPDDRLPKDLGFGECIENVEFSLSGEKAYYDIYRVDMPGHPLIDLLPIVIKACKVSNAKYRPRRSLGQITSIEIVSREGHWIDIELDDDIPKHRSRAMGGMWVETDLESLIDDLDDEMYGDT